MYFKLSVIKKINSGIKKTVPDILNMANACTLFVANELTISAENGVKRVNRSAMGIYCI